MTRAKETMRTEVKAHLDVWDFNCDHQSVSSAFGLEPSRVWNPGDKIGRTTRRQSSIGWRFDSELASSKPAAEHVRFIVDKILPRKSYLRSIGQFEAWIVCVLHVYEGDRPDLVFEAELITALGELSIGLDIDLYNFR